MKKKESEKSGWQARMASVRFNSSAGMRLKTAGVVFCVFVFSLGMIDKNQPESDPDQVLYHIERFYLIKDQPDSRSRFSWYAPLLALMEKTRGEIREVTAYNAGDENQCAGDPCISANGENLCEALAKGYKRCAANFVPLGTRLLIENHGEFVVTDRMNRRYSHRVDIAMTLEEKDRAKTFGLQRLKVTVLESPARLASADSSPRK
jgi:3D (Asp-Asp-Asp) domain-containing protein